MNRHDIGRWIRHYTYGCFAKSWNGAIAAAYGFIGTAIGSVVDPQHIQVPSWRTAAYVFGVSFVITALGYFKDNPLPSKIPE